MPQHFHFIQYSRIMNSALLLQGTSSGGVGPFLGALALGSLGIITIAPRGHSPPKYAYTQMLSPDLLQGTSSGGVGPFLGALALGSLYIIAITPQ